MVMAWLRIQVEISNDFRVIYLSPLGDQIKDIGSAYYNNYNNYYYWAKIMSVTQAIQHHSFFNIYLHCALLAGSLLIFRINLYQTGFLGVSTRTKR